MINEEDWKVKAAQQFIAEVNMAQFQHDNPHARITNFFVAATDPAVQRLAAIIGAHSPKEEGTS